MYVENTEGTHEYYFEGKMRGGGGVGPALEHLCVSFYIKPRVIVLLLKQFGCIYNLFKAHPDWKKIHNKVFVTPLDHVII